MILSYLATVLLESAPVVHPVFAEGLQVKLPGMSVTVVQRMLKGYMPSQGIKHCTYLGGIAFEVAKRLPESSESAILEAHLASQALNEEPTNRRI